MTIPDTDRKYWEDLANKGLGARQIALKTNHAWDSVANHLKSVGLFKKGFGANSKLTDGQKDEIIELYKAGNGATTIAKDFDIDKKAVYYVLNRAGVGTRSQHDRVSGPTAVRSTMGLVW